MDIKINNLLKADVFSSLFQHIKLFTEHINITFSDEKMYLQTMDGSRVSIVEMNLPSSWFDEYTINDSAITMGVQANVLFKVLNCRDKDQTIHLDYEADSDKLCIHFTSEKQQSFDKHFEINLIDLDVELLEIPSFDSNTDISVPSSYFAGTITQLQIFGDTIEFECSEEKVQLISHSVDSGKMKVDIDVDELTGYSITEGEVMKISFSLSRIHNICNYHKLSKEMDIILTNDYPMKIIYKLDDEDASMIFYLAPKIGDD
jgi:proliferating cell nuclear antigen